MKGEMRRLKGKGQGYERSGEMYAPTSWQPPVPATRHPCPTHQHSGPQTWLPGPSSVLPPQPQIPGVPVLAATNRPQELRPQHWSPEETKKVVTNRVRFWIEVHGRVRERERKPVIKERDTDRSDKLIMVNRGQR